MPQQRVWYALISKHWDQLRVGEYDKYYCMGLKVDMNAPLLFGWENPLPMLHSYLCAVDKHEPAKSFKRKLRFMRLLHADPALVYAGVSPISIYVSKRSQMPCNFPDFCAEIHFTAARRDAHVIATHLQLIAMSTQLDLLENYWLMLTSAEKRTAPTHLLHYPLLSSSSGETWPITLMRMLQFMMDRMGQDPDARLQGLTPLHRAARFNFPPEHHEDLMQTLLDGGADPLLRCDEKRQTARELSQATAVADLLAVAETHRRAMRYACLQVFMRRRLSRDLFRRILARSFRRSVYLTRLYRIGTASFDSAACMAFNWDEDETWSTAYLSGHVRTIPEPTSCESFFFGPQSRYDDNDARE